MNSIQILTKVKEFLNEKIKYYDEYLNYYIDNIEEYYYAEYLRMKILYQEILRYIEELEKEVNR